jgi:hypothetical protein
MQRQVLIKKMKKPFLISLLLIASFFMCAPREPDITTHTYERPSTDSTTGRETVIERYRDSEADRAAQREADRAAQKQAEQAQRRAEQEAQRKAEQEAQKKADKAQRDADKAQERANKAQERADKVQRDADKARERADRAAQREADRAAQKQAEQAQREADKAQKDAEKAQKDADKAQAQADRAAQRRVEQGAQGQSDRTAQREAEREQKRAEREQKRAEREQRQADRAVQKQAEQAQRRAEQEAQRKAEQEAQKKADKAQRDAGKAQEGANKAQERADKVQERVEQELRGFLKGANIEGSGVFRANKDFWEKKEALGWFSLKSSALSSSQVLEDMVRENSSKYAFDCSNLVYFAQLYAILKAIGTERFDKEMERKALTYNTYEHKTHFIQKMQLSRDLSESKIPIGADITLSLRGTLKKADSGVSEPFSRMIPDSWLNEHILKIGDNKYFGLGLNSIETPLSWQEIVTKYAYKIVSLLGERKFGEFGDNTFDYPMSIGERSFVLIDKHIYVDDIHEIVLDRD